MILRTVTLASQLGSVTIGEPTYAAGGNVVGFTLSDIELAASPHRLTRESYQVAPGGMVAQSPVEPREVTISGALWATSAAEANALRSELVLACMGDVVVRYAPEGEDRELTGLLDGGVEFQQAGGYCMRFRLRLVCANPIAYAANTTTAAVGGTAGPLVNDGDGEVWPDLAISVSSGTLTALTITNSRTARALRLSGLSAAAGSTITIVQRPGYEEVLVGSVSSMNRLETTSRFWSLLPGSNSITVTATGASVTTQASYRSGWVS